MAFKTFTSGDVLTASDLNTFLMRQSVIVCTSSTRPSAPSDGMLVYETDTDLFRVYNGSSWVDLYDSVGGGYEAYTPTFTATGWTLGNGTISGRFQQVGKMVVAVNIVTFGSTTVFGAASPTIEMTLPVTAYSGFFGPGLGTGLLVDVSLSTEYLASVALISTTKMRISSFITNSQINIINSTTPFTWASGDYIMTSVIYEAA